MPIYFILRVASILATLLVVAYSPTQKILLNIVYSLALAHYVLAFVYSRRQITDAFRQPYGLVPLLSIVFLGAGLYAGQFSLLFFFGLHHAFNEAFIMRATLSADDPDVKSLRGSAVLVHFLLYLFILRRQAGFTLGSSNPFYTFVTGYGAVSKYLPFILLVGALVASYGVFFYYLYRLRRLLTARTLIENCGLEILGLVVAAASFTVFFSYLYFVLYHVVFWSLFPLPKISAAGKAQLGWYLGLSAACVAAFVVISPIGPVFTSRYAAYLFQKQFILWTYIHITSSFLLSNAHPEWIVNLFRPIKGGAALAEPSTRAA
jgi:hypothetical protein